MIAFVSQLLLEVIALSYHVELALSVSPVRSVTEVAGSDDSHHWAIWLVLLVHPGPFGMESPVTVCVLVDVDVVRFVKEFDGIQPVEAWNVLLDEATLVEAVGLRRGDDQVAGSIRR